MPELPEVETVRRGLLPILPGRRIAGVLVRRRDLRRTVPLDFGPCVVGRRIEGLARRGKVLLWDLSDGGTVLIHLGMSGHVETDPQAPLGPHHHLRFTLDDGGAVTFCDPRRFGFVDYAAPGSLAADPLLARLGPEPLAPAFSAAALAAGLSGRSGPVKTALLDQALVAGLGNIYVCEALYRAGISPAVAAGSLSAARVARLAEAIAAVLAEAVEAGGSSLRDHRRPDGTLGYFQMRFAVYDREGEPCPAHPDGANPRHRIKRIVQSGRSTYYCPGCQR
ncbi:bifunctional DNA-formamidopyrimidine glycosylase/DNA-(apurinic or apyrimidinic site) lyase [Oleispirillum naphthae]|uniref:bifunctional DNA-formamidopyrimidine glycosylase/DNA-(apurinic or apyrimidinic site) lyase n=1 Tax=Oleispirillum naphthae TaxID=2838853 RepID=UPI0030826488